MDKVPGFYRIPELDIDLWLGMALELDMALVVDIVSVLQKVPVADMAPVCDILFPWEQPNGSSDRGMVLGMRRCSFLLDPKQVPLFWQMPGLQLFSPEISSNVKHNTSYNTLWRHFETNFWAVETMLHTILYEGILKQTNQLSDL